MSSAPLCLANDASASPRRQALAAVLQLLGRGVIAYHPKLVAVSGGVSPALMLSQALYWTRILALSEKARDGWFWKTQAEWQAETALTRHEQASARKKLLQHPFWLEERRGMPARIWFRVDLGALARVLDSAFSGRWDWSDRKQLLDLLGRPLIVHRSLAAVCESVGGAILLSRLLAELRISDRRVVDGLGRASRWHPLNPARLMGTTGLSRAEFYRARRELRSRTILDELRQGVPPQIFWQLDLALLTKLLQASKPTEAEAEGEQKTLISPQFAGIEAIDCGFLQTRMRISANWLYGFRQTGCTESGKLVVRNPANLIAGIETPSLPDSVFPYKGLTTGLQSTHKNPPPTPSTDSGAASPEVGVGSSIDSLIWPERVFLPAELPTAKTLLAAVPDEAQCVLDELAGQVAKGVVRSPLAYLRQLTLQAREGRFVPVLAARVADRRARSERLRAVSQAQTDALQQAAEDATPVALSPDQRADRAAVLRELRARLRFPAKDSRAVCTLNTPPSRGRS